LQLSWLYHLYLRRLILYLKHFIEHGLLKYFIKIDRLNKRTNYLLHKISLQPRIDAIFAERQHLIPLEKRCQNREDITVSIFRTLNGGNTVDRSIRPLKMGIVKSSADSILRELVGVVG